MSNIYTQADTKSQELRAVITRADGTVVDLGTIAYYSKNPLKMWWWKAKQWIKGR